MGSPVARCQPFSIGGLETTKIEAHLVSDAGISVWRTLPQVRALRPIPDRETSLARKAENLLTAMFTLSRRPHGSQGL